MPAYETTLYRRIHDELRKVRLIDTHEYLQRERELPAGQAVHIGRFFAHYASCDLVSAGMRPADMVRVQTAGGELSDGDRWRMIKPFYQRARNTMYFDALRIA